MAAAAITNRVEVSYIEQDIREFLQIDATTQLTKEVVLQHWNKLSEKSPQIREFAQRHNFVWIEDYMPGIARFAHARIEQATRLQYRLPHFSESLHPTDLPSVVYLHCLVKHLERPNEQGDTELHRLALNDSINEIEMLFKIGVDRNLQDKKGRTMLHYAADAPLAENTPQYMRTLLKYGVNPNIPNNRGRTPLHDLICTRGGYYSCLTSARLLIRAGAEVNHQDENGNTPLHYACARDNDARAKTLRDAGAISVANNRGQMPEDLAPKCCVIL